jgi:hypothetical protein
MCHNPDPSNTPFCGPKTIHRHLTCTSTLRLCCALVALLPKQRCHEGHIMQRTKGVLRAKAFDFWAATVVPRSWCYIILDVP